MPILVSKSSTATIGSIGPVEVIITHQDDSIRLGDGTNLTDVTVNGELEVFDEGTHTRLDTIISQTDGIEASLASIDAKLTPAVVGDKYSAFISVRQGAATAAGSVVWSMRNAAAATKDAYIDKIEIQMAFDSATPATRSTQRYGIVRFSGATPTGGSVITPTHMDTASAAPQVSDIRTLTSGLGVVGVVIGTTLAFPAIPAADGSTMILHLSDLGLRLRPGEGLAINLLVTAVIGQYIGGFVSWSER